MMYIISVVKINKDKRNINSFGGSTR